MITGDILYIIRTPERFLGELPTKKGQLIFVDGAPNQMYWDKDDTTREPVGSASWDDIGNKPTNIVFYGEEEIADIIVNDADTLGGKTLEEIKTEIMAASASNNLYIVDTIDERNALEPTFPMNVYVKDAAGTEKSNPSKWSQFNTALADYWFNNRTASAFSGLGDIGVLGDELLIRKNDAGEPFASWEEFADSGEAQEADPLFKQLLDAMSDYARTGNTAALNSAVTVPKLANLKIRRTDSGNTWVTAYLTTARNRAKRMVDSAKLDPAYWDGTNVKISWYQAQHAFIMTNDEVIPSTASARAKNYTWAPEWAKLAYPMAPASIALQAISDATNAADYINPTAKTVSTSYWLAQYAIINYGPFTTAPTADEIRSKVKYPWKYIAGGDPTVKRGGAYYLWDETEWGKTAEAESMDVVTKWDDVQDKPEAFAPVAHAATHEVGGSDAIDPIKLQAVYRTYTPKGGVDGRDYAITIPGVDSINWGDMLFGKTITIIPHTISTSLTPLLVVDINDSSQTVGVVRRTSNGGLDYVVPIGFLFPDRPVQVSFDGNDWNWILEGLTTLLPEDIAEGGGVTSYNGIKPDDNGNVSNMGVTFTPDGGEVGKDYAVTIQGISKMYDGLKIQVTPHVLNNVVYTLLNLNGLGGIPIARAITYANEASDYLPVGFLVPGTQIELVYSVKQSHWMLQGFNQVDYKDVAGLPNDSYMVGPPTIGDYPITKTPDEVRAHIGALGTNGGTFDGLIDLQGDGMVLKVGDGSQFAIVDKNEDGLLGVENGIVYANRDVSLQLHKIVDLAAPEVGTDGANKQYVDDETAKCLPAKGGTMMGDITLLGNKLRFSGYQGCIPYIEGKSDVNGVTRIVLGSEVGGAPLLSGLNAPVDPTDAANKRYVDEQVGGNIIPVHYKVFKPSGTVVGEGEITAVKRTGGSMAKAYIMGAIYFPQDTNIYTVELDIAPWKILDDLGSQSYTPLGVITNNSQFFVETASLSIDLVANPSCVKIYFGNSTTYANAIFLSGAVAYVE